MLALLFIGGGSGILLRLRMSSTIHANFITTLEIFRDLEAKVWNKTPAQFIELKPFRAFTLPGEGMFEYRIHGFDALYHMHLGKLEIEYFRDSQTDEGKLQRTWEKLTINLKQDMTPEVRASIEVLLSDKRRKIVWTTRTHPTITHQD